MNSPSTTEHEAEAFEYALEDTTLVYIPDKEHEYGKLNYKCQFCSLPFDDISSLMRHLKEKHRKTYPFPPKGCGKGNSYCAENCVYMKSYTGTKPQLQGKLVCAFRVEGVK